MNNDYRRRAGERAVLGVPPLPLGVDETRQVCQWLSEGRSSPPDGDENLLELLAGRVPAGVDPAAKVKAEFLGAAALDGCKLPALTREKAVELLGSMLGGFNIPPLIACVEAGGGIADSAAAALSRCLLVDEASLARLDSLRLAGNKAAAALFSSWAGAEWFASAPTLPAELRLVVYKVPGEVNTDDLSPAKQAVTRPDVPLHALSMGESRFPGGVAEIARLRALVEDKGGAVAFVADTVGTGSSRKSAVNSLAWHLGRDIPRLPNKRRGGVILADRIAPIFYNNFEDIGGLPIRVATAKLATGDEVSLRIDPAAGSGSLADASGKPIATFAFPPALADEWRAGGRINLIIGRKLSARAAKALGREMPDIFAKAAPAKAAAGGGYTLAQKLVGRACGRDGVRPGEYCEPAMSTVGSQDTTGPMTRDELTDLACLRFSAPLVLQSFCHTAAYPTDRDRDNHRTMPVFFQERGGVALRPGDGIIHSWLNRMLVPDRVGTGGDSHTRFPLGISFAAGSGLVALAAAMGFMPLDMPESVRVGFSGKLRPGITWRDAVNAIPLEAMRQGLLDRPGQGSKNVFNGRILEMEGLSGLTVEQGFELACASAERSAAACTVDLGGENVAEYVRSNVVLLKKLLSDGYQDRKAIENRIGELQAWLDKPELLRRDPNAEFAASVDIDLGGIAEPVLACPNNPDLVALLSREAGTPVDEVFIGSCMTNIAHFRAAAAIFAGPGAGLGVKRLWITPPTRMDHDALAHEGVLQCFEKFGARIEIPGCSLCMGNQARVADGATVFSTSTRNFDNRMGKEARVYLGSAEVAAVTARLGRVPTPEEYFRIYNQQVLPRLAEIGQPLYFHRLNEYK